MNDKLASLMIPPIATPIEKILIVRLSSLGDIVQAIPVAAALRERFPEARIDWLVDPHYRKLLDMVTTLDHVIQIDLLTQAGRRNALGVISKLRSTHYDCTLDLQGLFKSAILARASGAKRVIGFSMATVREKGANFFYTETCNVKGCGPLIYMKNLSLLKNLGITTSTIRFPLRTLSTTPTATVRERLGLPLSGSFALLVPGASWANKRWPAERFGQLARLIFERYSIPSVILKGNPEEYHLSLEAVDASRGTAIIAPPTTFDDLIAIMRLATIVVSADTGPLHIAVAVGTPVVGLYGPTDPEKNSPLGAHDQCVSRYTSCECKHQRRCHAQQMCIADISVNEVANAIDACLSSTFAKTHSGNLRNP